MTGQLQYALNSRIVIEQAKGAVAQQLGVEMDEAFDALRRYSRDNNQRLLSTATSVVDRSLEIGSLSSGRQRPPADPGAI